MNIRWSWNVSQLQQTMGRERGDTVASEKPGRGIVLSRKDRKKCRTQLRFGTVPQQGRIKTPNQEGREKVSKTAAVRKLAVQQGRRGLSQPGKK